jgi:hypothetical protein
MKKQQDLKSTSSGAGARTDVSAGSNAGHIPSSFEDWLSEDAPLISADAWQPIPMPQALAPEPEGSSPENDHTNPSAN